MEKSKNSRLTKKIKFQKFLFLMVSTFVGIILVVSGTVFYMYSASQMESNAAKNQVNATIKVQEQISMTMKEMDRIAIAVNTSEYIVNILSGIPNEQKQNYFDYNPRISSSIKNALYSFMSLKNFKARIKLVSRYYDHTGLATQYDKNISKAEIRNSTMGYEAMMTSDTYKFFLPPHDDIWTSYNSSVISVVRPIRDNYSNVFGFVELNLPIAELDKMVDGLNIAILDNHNKIVYTNALLTDEQRKYYENIQYKEDSSIVDTSDIGLISSQSSMRDIGWHVVQFTEQNAYNYPNQKMGVIILITYILVFVVLLLVLYWIIRGLTKPIRRLTDIVTNADANDPNLNLHTEEVHGDIEMLADSFQELIQTVHHSSRQLVEMKTRETKTQIMALEAQLNPHFIYNTLSVIGAYGMKAGNDTVYDMCSDLSLMLRYTVDYSKKATLKSEIEHMGNYLALMKKRYENMFSYTIENEISSLDIKVPKLIIQPIVENCFMHGFQCVDGPWEIHIKLYVDNNEWRIRVKDNGTGFTQSQIISIKNILLEDDILNIKSSIGMVNTFYRLHHYYDGKEYLNFYSENGAVVEIGGPIANEKY